MGHFKPSHKESNPLGSIFKQTVSKLVDKPVDEHSSRQSPVQKIDMLSAYPNPANEYVLIDYRVQNPEGGLWLVISDAKG